MKREVLIENIKRKESYLCVGLDTDINKIPSHLLNSPDPIFEFNKQIIDSTYKYAVAYKPNIAFYEALGSKGWESLEKTIEYIPKDIFTIADAKRGDIGNTSSLYAKAFFETMNFDSITVSPYMGVDSVKPFLDFDNKWVILLALTSNIGSEDFQKIELKNDTHLYEEILKKSIQWGNESNLMFVVGATQAESILKIRKIIPEHFLLVPGVGAQGGDLEEISKFGLNKDCGLLINSSRNIIYSSNGKDFAQQAEKESIKIMNLMKKMLDLYSK